MKHSLGLGRILPPARFESETPWSYFWGLIWTNTLNWISGLILPSLELGNEINLYIRNQLMGQRCNFVLPYEFIFV